MTEEKRPKKRRWLVIAAILLGVCVVGGVIQELSSPGQERLVEVTVIVTSTMQPSATLAPPTAMALPVPSATVTVPTQTPRPTQIQPPPTAMQPPPTNTPTATQKPPTATPTAGVPLAVQLYAMEAAKTLGTFSEALTTLGELAMEPKFGDAAWTVNAALQVTLVRLAHEDLEKMDPPAEVADIHEALLDGTQDCYDAMDEFETGVDELDASALLRAEELILSCGKKMQESARLLNERVAQWK